MTLGLLPSKVVEVAKAAGFDVEACVLGLARDYLEWFNRRRFVGY
jgi:hypothetical protein